MTLPTDIIAVSIDEVWRARDRLVGALSPRERRELEGFRVTKRKRDWLAGRIAAKRAAQRQTGAPFSRISVNTVRDGPDRGRPYLLRDDEFA